MKKDTVVTLSAAQFNFTAHPLEIGPVYETIARQAATQEEADEILAVAEKLIGLNDRDLYLAAHDEAPVAPRIGGSNFPETTLKALANFKLGERERKRSDRKWLFSNIVGWVMALIGWGVAIFLALNK